MPKSQSLISPSWLKSMLEGFTSEERSGGEREMNRWSWYARRKDGLRAWTILVEVTTVDTLSLSLSLSLPLPLSLVRAHVCTQELCKDLASLEAKWTSPHLSPASSAMHDLCLLPTSAMAPDFLMVSASLVVTGRVKGLGIDLLLYLRHRFSKCWVSWL